MTCKKRTIKQLLPLTCMLGALVLSGCDSYVNQMRLNGLGQTPPSAMPSVKPQAASVDLKLDQHGGLTQDSLASLNQLLQQQGRLSQQTLVLTPANTRGEKIAQRLATRLVAIGIPANKINVLPVAASAANAHGDLNVLSQALVVTVPDCRIANAQEYTVHPYQSIGPLGCATRANLAKMVADPQDLLRARPLDAGDGQAAENAVGRYYDDDIRELLDIDFNED